MAAAAPLLLMNGATSIFNTYQETQEKVAQNKYENAQLQLSNNVMNQVAAQKEEEQRDQSERDISSSRVAASASGVDYTEGSLAEVRQDQAVQEEMKALNIRYERQVNNAEFQTKFDYNNWQRKKIRREGNFKMATTAFNTGSKMFGGLAPGGGE